MTLSFILGVHCHQPLGNFPDVFERAYQRAYRPFLSAVERYPGIRIALHVSGVLLEWLEQERPEWLAQVKPLVAAGRIELLGGACYEPILPILPDHDKIGQIQRHLDLLEQTFGVRPQGMWLAERVWEPSLARPLARAGIRYTFLDDFHFVQAGLSPAQLSGHFYTEEQGEGVSVFPISQRLRYLIPFAAVEEVLDHLRGLGGGVAVMADDGEKFGVWPDTHTLCYQEKWLERFFEGLLSQGWIDVATPGSVLDRLASSGKVYIPTGSYREMTEWALPVESGRALARVKARVEALPDGGELLRWVRGGHWRNFLVKYPEANDLYCRMLRVSQDIAGALASDPGDPLLTAARDELWRGQCNDGYWHGIFGGLYLPHLRRALWQALLRAERLVLQRRLGQGAWRQWEAADRDGDGQPELYLGTTSLALTIHPARGGGLAELSVRSVPLNLLDTLTRRPEAYHDLEETEPHAPPSARVRTIHASLPGKAAPGVLRYDRHRRMSFLEAILPWSADLAAWERGEGTALHDFAATPWRGEVREDGEAGLSIVLRPVDPSAVPVDLEKIASFTAGKPSVTFQYAVRPRARVRFTLTSQWNLALTAGKAPGRYFELPGRPSLAAEGETEGTRIVLVDEWIGLQVELAWHRPARLHYAPIHTLSLSEAGFEQIYQGTSLVVGWPVALTPGEVWQESLTLTVSGR